MADRGPALAQALERLRAADRRRRLRRSCWFALGGAAFALAAGFALAHSPSGSLPSPLVAAIAVAAAVAGFLAGRTAPLSDELLARSVDAGSELPQLALTVVTPLAHHPGGLGAAVRDQTEQELRSHDRPHRLPLLPLAVWPALGTGAALCFFLLLPQPPDGARPKGGQTDPPQVRPDSSDGSEDEAGSGAGAGRAAGSGGSDGDQPKQPQAGADPQARPEPQPQSGGVQPAPKEAPSSTTPGDGSSELYGDPDRLKVNTEKVKIDSLFDEALEGVKRTVLLPDPPKPTPSPSGAERPRGSVPDEIARADEAALNERIADPAERDTVARYFELLGGSGNSAGTKEPQGK
jgi:hypothetical protein